ncbi:MAG: hypothetical protein ABSA70_11335, partial [Terriglobia bacterium]
MSATAGFRQARFIWSAFLLLALLTPALAGRAETNAGALVLVNSQAADYQDFSRCIEPYLVQFGVPYQVRDLAREGLGEDLGDYALVIIGHRSLDVPHRFLTSEGEQQLLAAVRSGTGLVSFDGLLAAWSSHQPKPLYSFAQKVFGLTFRAPEEATSITVGGSSPHYITQVQPVPR